MTAHLATATVGQTVTIRHDGHPLDGQTVTVTRKGGTVGGIGGGGDVDLLLIDGTTFTGSRYTRTAH